MLESLVAIGTLIFLEGILSVDNALAMALQVRSLEASLQRRALLYGMWGAFILRAVAILGAKWLMSIWWLQIAGALYLVYLVIAHFALRREAHLYEGKDSSPREFWSTIAMVELTDAAFAIDSTLVAVGMSNHLWVVLAGVALGILAVRYAAMLFVKLLQNCPEIEHLGFILVGWVAVRLFSEGFEKMSALVLHQPYPERILPERVFWSVIAILVAIGAALVLRANLPNENRIAHLSARCIESCQEMIHRLPLPPRARRVVVLIIGSMILLIGVAMIFLPGPAFIIIPAGLAILATEFQWAQKLLDKIRLSVRKVLRRADHV
jgi:YkoY family integral membrane protein